MHPQLGKRTVANFYRILGCFPISLLLRTANIAKNYNADETLWSLVGLSM